MTERMAADGHEHGHDVEDRLKAEAELRKDTDAGLAPPFAKDQR